LRPKKYGTTGATKEILVTNRPAAVEGILGERLASIDFEISGSSVCAVYLT